jgi:hypothetical protein
MTTTRLRLLRATVVACGMAALIVVASGCGGPSAAEKQAKAAAQQHAKCKADIGPFLTALKDLNSRLDVGLSFQAYSDQVGNVKVAYDRVPFKQLSLPCLKVGGPAEGALNAYISAYSVWNKCIGDTYCSTDSIDSELQGHWETARLKIERAQAALDRI